MVSSEVSTPPYPVFRLGRAAAVRCCVPKPHLAFAVLVPVEAAERAGVLGGIGNLSTAFGRYGQALAVSSEVSDVAVFFAGFAGSFRCGAAVGLYPPAENRPILIVPSVPASLAALYLALHSAMVRRAAGAAMKDARMARQKVGGQSSDEHTAPRYRSQNPRNHSAQ